MHPKSVTTWGWVLSCKADTQQEVLLFSQILSLIQGTSAAGKEQIQGAELKWSGEQLWGGVLLSFQNAEDKALPNTTLPLWVLLIASGNAEVQRLLGWC